MVRKLALILFVIFLVGSVYAHVPDPGDPYRDVGCTTRPLVTYGDPPIPYACFIGGGFGGSYGRSDWGVLPGNSQTEEFDLRYPGLSFPSRDIAWASNCVCQTPNLAKIDYSVCAYDFKNIIDDMRYTWPVWGANKIPPGLFINWVSGHQVMPDSCKSCQGPAVGVYGESFTATHPNPIPAQTPPGEPSGRPVEVTYLRCDTSSLTQDGSQKAYGRDAVGPGQAANYDLIYGSWTNGVYQCGYAPDLRKGYVQSATDPNAIFFNSEIPVVGMILSELDPNRNNIRRMEESQLTDPVIKSFDKTKYGNACNPIATCPVNTGCPGDLNGDGKVDNSDMAILSENWKRGDCSPSNGCCGGVDIAKCPGETGNTGRVNECDLAVIAANFGKSCKDIVPVPPRMPPGDIHVGPGGGLIWIW